MADIQVGNLISLVELVRSFNDKVWVELINKVGSVHARNAATLSQDTAPKTGGNVTPSTQGVPQLNATAWIGVNTTAHNNKIPVKNAVQPNQLRTVSSGTREFFTLKWQDIASHSSGDIVNANDVYSACINVLKHLISIRPAYTTWRHDASGTAAGNAFTISEQHYCYYVDWGSIPNVDMTRYVPMSSSYYQFEGYSKGGQVNIYSALDPHADPNNTITQNVHCRTDQSMLAYWINKQIEQFWKGWSDRCYNTNKFTYQYHSCHISCHNVCHSNSRHRR